MTETRVVDTEGSAPTASGRISYEPKGLQTASGSAVLARQYALLRDRVGVLNEDVNERHRQARTYDLDERARSKAKRSVPSLLEQLSNRGIAWRDLARLVGVSVSAVRKWRQGGHATGESRFAVAQLAAFLDLLEGFMIEDPVGWMELPVADGFTVRHLDVYEAGRPDLLLDLADLRIRPNEALDQMDPQWRTKFASEFEVFEAGDHNLSIRKRTKV